MSSSLHVYVFEPTCVREGRPGSATAEPGDGLGDGLGEGLGAGDGVGLGEGDDVALAIVTCRVPVTPWYVAMIVAVPALTPPTIPAGVTVATAVLVDCHVACAVTDCVVPLDRFAVAAN